MYELRPLLRILAATAVVGLLLWQSSSVSLGYPLVWSVAIFSIFAMAAFAALFLLAPDGLRHLERHPDLLVPLGLLVGTFSVFDAISGWHFGLTATLFTLPLIFSTIPVTLAMLAKGLLKVFFVLWATLLIVEVVRANHTDLPPGPARWWPKYLRFLMLTLLAWAVTTLLFVVEIPALIFLGMGTAQICGQFGVVVILLLLFGVLGFHYLLNLATVLVLPIAADQGRGVWTSLRHGMAESWRHRRRWWKLLLVEYLLMGAWIVIHYQYQQYGENTNFNFNLDYFAPWHGDYSYDSAWYLRAMKWLVYEPLAVVATLSGLLSLLVSLVVKLTIFERYMREPTAIEMPPVEEVAVMDGSL
jgi:hypothetical protein